MHNQEHGVVGMSGQLHNRDDEIWEPPEAEDPEDDIEGRVASKNDHGVVSDDGNKPSCSSSVRDDASSSFEFEQKAMEGERNRKLKNVVRQLLQTAGVAIEEFLWVDKITSLSMEAASFLKPGAILEEDAFVKVKFIATGSPTQSQVIRGLVFKIHAAQNHIPAKYEGPRLLLIRGMLEQSLCWKKDYSKLADMIERCRPNVVFVEKSVSLDIQESILERKVSLVYEMKLHRLERVALCTGSPILSSDGAIKIKNLTQYDSFYVQNFVEEHDGGKNPSKTLMFIEGCPTRLGCTILLKGSNSDELKRVKYVVQAAVVIAYQLILETSFLADQKAMFSSILSSAQVNVAPKESSDLQASEIEPSTSDIPIINEICEEGRHNSELEGDSALSIVPSKSLEIVKADRFPQPFSATFRYLYNIFGFNGREANDQIRKEVPILKTPSAFRQSDLELEGGSDEQNLIDGKLTKSLRSCFEPPLDEREYANCADRRNLKVGVNSWLDNQSILVFMSSRNASKGTICEQNRISQINLYRNLDDPLGKFLRDNLLNQKRQCSTCRELPEAHFYYYAHHNKRVEIRVRALMKRLPGEAEGKIWMWSHCGKCKDENGVLRWTKRVVISNVSRNLSFGKFLEFSLSHHSFSGVSTCGHSLEGDFVNFFGLGPMAAKFKYSPVTAFTVSLPSLRLEFSHAVNNDLLKDYEDVLRKGTLLFHGISAALEKFKSQPSLKLGGSSMKISDVEKILGQECSDFKERILREKTGLRFVSLNRLLWELLLESFIWERRLHSLHLFCDADGTIHGKNDGSLPKSMEQKAIPITADTNAAIELFWRPFAEIRQTYLKILQKHSVQKYESTSRYVQENVRTVRQLISEEGQRLYIPLENTDYFVRDYEDELSSIIVCALALMKDLPVSTASDGLNLQESLISSENISPQSFGKGKYSVNCLYAEEFQELRSRCYSSELEYMASLSRCKNWDAKGGKSKSVFAKTKDDRLIIKEIQKIEFDSFVQFAPKYFKHMNASFDGQNQTCLAKVLGIYQVTVREAKNGNEERHDLMVMENLSFGRIITRQYDLKGALHARFTADGGAEDVLLDQNFVNDINNSLLFVSGTSKDRLDRAVSSDTSFLTTINVMDYSLLVGVDREKKEVVCGIIDYLRQYTLDKRAETWLKRLLMVHKKHLPTVISPIKYEKRFQTFLGTNFLSVPDTWSSSLNF